MSPPLPPLVDHKEVVRRLADVVSQSPAIFAMEKVGESIEGRSINYVRAGTGPVRCAPLVADARRRVDRDISALRPLRLPSPSSSGPGRRADAVAADAACRADAEPGRRRALRAPERTKHRHQSRCVEVADSRGQGAQGVEGPAEPARRLQPPQSERADIGRHSSAAGVHLSAVGRLRRSRARKTPGES